MEQRRKGCRCSRKSVAKRGPARGEAKRKKRKRREPTRYTKCVATLRATTRTHIVRLYIERYRNKRGGSKLRREGRRDGAKKESYEAQVLRPRGYIIKKQETSSFSLGAHKDIKWKHYITSLRYVRTDTTNTAAEGRRVDGHWNRRRRRRPGTHAPVLTRHFRFVFSLPRAVTFLCILYIHGYRAAMVNDTEPRKLFELLENFVSTFRHVSIVIRFSEWGKGDGNVLGLRYLRKTNPWRDDW